MVMVVVLSEEVFDVFDGVSVVLSEDGWDVLEKDYGCVVDGSGLKQKFKNVRSWVGEGLLLP